MKTIATHPAAYIDKQGKRPRFFIRIPSANLFLATKTQTDSGSAEAFVDKVQRLGTITEEIDWLGGMGSVSGLDMESIELGQRVTLCTEVTIAPEPVVQSGLIVAGAGRLRWASPVYLTARNSAVGGFDTGALVIGRTLSGATYVVNRAYIQFTLPAGITSCEEAVIELDGFGDYSDTDFNYAAVAGTFTTLDGTVYNDFTGWAASGAYSVSRYSDLVNSSEYSATAKNKIRFDATGRAAVVTNTGGTLKVMILSYQDYTNAAAPTGDEFVQFVSSTARLKLRYNTVTLDNAEAEIYLDYEPVSTTYTAMQLLRKFIVDDYSIDDSSMTLRLRDNNFKHEPMIPGDVINIADWPDCPEKNIGLPVPLIYGQFDLTTEHRVGVGNYQCLDPGQSLDTISYPDCFRGPIVNGAGDARTVIFSRRQLKSYTSAKYLFTWNTSMKCYEALAVRSIPVYDSAIGTYRPLNPVRNTDQLIEAFSEGKYRSVATVIPYESDDVGAQNTAYAFDTDTATFGYINTQDGYMDFFFNQPAGVSAESVVGVVCYASFTAGAAAASLNFCLMRDERANTTDPENWTSVSTLTPWVAQGQQQYAWYDIEDNVQYKRRPIQLGQYKFRLQKKDNGGQCNIYDVCALVAHDVAEMTEVYSYGMGAPDDGSGTITGTPSALLEIPAHVMESIARSEMALATANINTGSFDTSATALAAWKSAFQITDRKEAPVHLDGMAKEAKSRVFWDYADTLKIKTFSSTAAFPVSGTDIPTGFDIFDRTGTPVSGSFTTNPIMPNSLEIGRIEKDEVYSDFVLHYKKNYASGEYGATLYMTNGLGVTGSIETNISESNLENSQTLAALKTLCATAYTIAGATRTLDINADFIRDTATATKYLQYLIERTTERRYTVTLTTRFNAVRHELGDFINVRDARLNDLFGEATVERKKWEITRMLTDLDGCEITIKTVEVD